MSEEPTPAEIQNRIRELLGRATLLRARGDHEQALKLAQEALVLDQASWEGHELVGDVLLDLKRADQAMQSYRAAWQLNKSRPALEEKIGRAALAQARKQHTLEMARALLEGKGLAGRPKRNPGYAALLSLVVPGLGQVYNMEAAKGLVIVAVWIVLFALNVSATRVGLGARPAPSGGILYGQQVDANAILHALFSGVGVLWFGLIVIVWIYSVADAAIRASKTMTSDSTGLV
jgi:tetratricopeptide (TPR) repeat protein